MPDCFGVHAAQNYDIQQGNYAKKINGAFLFSHYDVVAKVWDTHSSLGALTLDQKRC